MPHIDNRILTDVVYERIKSMIDDGDMPTGEKIRKQELAEMLGVSQTPVNEALSRLAGEKFIEQRKRQGYFVRQFSDEELWHLFEVRAGIEGMAIRLCIENATPEELDTLCSTFDEFEPPLSRDDYHRYTVADKHFHESVIRFSGNPFMEELLTSFGYLIKSNQKGLVRPPEETSVEHREIVAAIRERDSHRAQELMIQHHLKSRDSLMRRAANVPTDGHQQR